MNGVAGGSFQKVLNTRPREQAAELSRLLEAAGFVSVELAALEIVAVADSAELDLARQRLAAGAYAWLVLASQNAARFLPETPRETRVLCGVATARALGLSDAETLERFSARDALGVLRQKLRPGERVLVPRAEDGRDELVDGLAAAGVDFEAPVCYGTRAVSPDRLRHAVLAAGELAAVTFCSPSAVRSLVTALGSEHLRRMRLVCIGQTTADAARAFGLDVAAIAERTDMPALVRAVSDALGVAA